MKSHERKEKLPAQDPWPSQNFFPFRSESVAACTPVGRLARATSQKRLRFPCKKNKECPFFRLGNGLCSMHTVPSIRGTRY
jgi:hypothetical protein